MKYEDILKEWIGRGGLFLIPVGLILLFISIFLSVVLWVLWIIAMILVGIPALGLLFIMTYRMGVRK